MNDPETADYEKSMPATWMAAALSAALAEPELLNAPERQRALHHLAVVQEILKEYHPTEDGGWNLLRGQQDPARHHLYATTLGLLALLEAHRAGVPWEGSTQRRDELIRRTAGWLINRYDRTGDPPGWRGLNEDTQEIYDGLTIQIFDELLKTQEMLEDFALPPEMRQEIPRQLALFARRDMAYPVNGGEFTALFRLGNGSETVGRRTIKYLWYPWVIDCSATWLRYAAREHLPNEQRVAVRRAQGHLVVDLGSEALARAKRDYTFFASEDLYGLSGVPPP
jgi:hypothetical protein